MAAVSEQADDNGCAVEPPTVSNKFSNDGSFMEMFRKRLEAQKGENFTDKRDTNSKLKTAAEAAPDPPGKTAVDNTSNKDEEEVQREKIYQGATGKRKALLKSAELREKRKKRKEEREGQKQAEEESQYQSAAWKAYMQEVKAIQARSCTDQDGHKRPLVK